MKTERLGIDVGGVIIDRVNDGTDTSFFSDNYLKTTAVSRAIETIARLAREKFGAENVFIVSTCGSVIRDKTVEWLAHQDFHFKTGVMPDQLYFCRKRSDKAEICKKLGITHFVDDRLEVLGFLLGIVDNRYLLNPEEKEVRKHKKFLSSVVQVKTWDEIYQEMMI